jgi:hypothetical protein
LSADQLEALASETNLKFAGVVSYPATEYFLIEDAIRDSLKFRVHPFAAWEKTPTLHYFPLHCSPHHRSWATMNNSETSHIDLHPSNKFCLVVDHCDHDYHLLERLFRRREIGLEMKRCTGAVEALKLLNVADYHSAALSKNLPVMIVLDLGSPGNEDGR